MSYAEKYTETICVKVKPSLHARMKNDAAKLEERPTSYVMRTALERFYQAVDEGILPPIAD